LLCTDWGQSEEGPMGRRADHQREELTVLALAAGEKLVVSKGMFGITVRQLMGDIGYSAGTFYNLFSNLDDFLLRLAGRTLERMLSESNSLQLSGDSVKDLKTLAAFYLDFTRSNTNLWQIVMEHRLPKDTSHPRWYRALVIDVIKQVEESIRPMFEEGDKEERRRSALTLWASMQGICSVTQPGSLTAAPEKMALELASKLIDFYVLGLRTQATRPG
jgi:AcrR family transcriptional regulator